MAYYRLYFLNSPNGGIVRFEELDAQSDEQATRQARMHQGEHALELWTGSRRVAQIEAADSGVRSPLKPGMVLRQHDFIADGFN